jgi:hypothetical protein
MSNTYRALSPAAVAAFADGVFEHDFSVSEEKDWLDSGLLEIAPRTYKVLSNNYERPQGETFDGAFLKEIEEALIQGGHLERVAAKKGGSTKKTAAAAGDEKKED